MKSKLTVLALLLFPTTSASAKGLGLIDLGIKAGVSTQNITLSHGTKSGLYALSTDARPSFQVGVVARLNFVMLHVQPELNYTLNRFRLRSEVFNGGEVSRSTVKYNNLDVPVLLGMRFLFIRLQAGPVFNISNATSVKAATSTPHAVEVIKPTVSYAIGLGIDLFKLNFDIRYNGRFARTDQHITIGTFQPVDYKSKFQGWTFSVAYMF